MQRIEEFVADGDEEFFADDEIDLLIRRAVTMANGGEVEDEINEVVVAVDLGAERRTEQIIRHNGVNVEFIHEFADLIMSGLLHVDPNEIVIFVARDHTHIIAQFMIKPERRIPTPANCGGTERMSTVECIYV